MQCNPAYPAHINTKEFHAGTKRRHQRDMVVQSELALRQQLTVHGNVLELVDMFQYLNHLLAQDNGDVQTVLALICKAWATWAQVGMFYALCWKSLKLEVKMLESCLLITLLEDL
jgi:hypothetical protein